MENLEIKDNLSDFRLYSLIICICVLYRIILSQHTEYFTMNVAHLYTEKKMLLLQLKLYVTGCHKHK